MANKCNEHIWREANDLPYIYCIRCMENHPTASFINEADEYDYVVVRRWRITKDEEEKKPMQIYSATEFKLNIVLVVLVEMISWPLIFASILSMIVIIISFLDWANHFILYRGDVLLMLRVFLVLGTGFGIFRSFHLIKQNQKDKTNGK